jgi:hypothetical protein
VIGMLTSSVLAVLAAAGWWWVTWPERTAREFAGLIGHGKFEEATKLVVHHTETDRQIVVDRRDFQWEFTQPLLSIPRTWLDVGIGRQHFRIGERPYGFVVQCGRIVTQGTTLADGRFKQASFLPLDEAALTDPFNVTNQILEVTSREFFMQEGNSK